MSDFDGASSCLACGEQSAFAVLSNAKVGVFESVELCGNCTESYSETHPDCERFSKRLHMIHYARGGEYATAPGSQPDKCCLCGRQVALICTAKDFWHNSANSYAFCSVCFDSLIHFGRYGPEEGHPLFTGNSMPLAAIAVLPDNAPLVLKMWLALGKGIEFMRDMEIEQLAWFLELEVVGMDLPFNGQWVNTPEGVIIFLNSALSEERKRWTFFHELAHVLQGSKEPLTLLTAMEVDSTGRAFEGMRDSIRRLAKKYPEVWARRPVVPFKAVSMAREMEAELFAGQFASRRPDETADDLTDSFNQAMRRPLGAMKDFAKPGLHGMAWALWHAWKDIDWLWVKAVLRDKQRHPVLRICVIPWWMVKGLAFLAMWLLLLAFVMFMAVSAIVLKVLLPRFLELVAWLEERPRTKSCLERSTQSILSGVRFARLQGRKLAPVFSRLQPRLRGSYRFLYSPMEEYCDSWRRLRNQK